MQRGGGLALLAPIARRAGARVSLFRPPSLVSHSWRAALPPLANEVLGVQHAKACVFDDTVVLTGANLSAEYFERRQDRYVVIRDAPALADVVCGVLAAVGARSTAYDPDGAAATKSTSVALNGSRCGRRRRRRRRRGAGARERGERRRARRGRRAPAAGGGRRATRRLLGAAGGAMRTGRPDGGRRRDRVAPPPQHETAARALLAVSQPAAGVREAMLAAARGGGAVEARVRGAASERLLGRRRRARARAAGVLTPRAAARAPRRRARRRAPSAPLPTARVDVPRQGALARRAAAR